MVTLKFNLFNDIFFSIRAKAAFFLASKMLNEKTLVSPNEDFNFAEVCRAADYLQEATLNLGPYQLHPDPRIFQIYSYS